MKNSQTAQSMETAFDRLWPIGRSITGAGYRESLDILSEIMPMERLRFATGAKVFDWTVPKEWVIRDAYLIDPNGNKRADYKTNNLHLLNYSVPFRGTLPLSELRPHLYSLPELPKAIPYLTSYYEERWGFCLTHEELLRLPEGNYEVWIDSELKNGHVEIGEALIRGRTRSEILLSSYLCHPSLANNELSGPLVLAFLYKKILALSSRRYTYRFALMPETIGSICYLSKRGDDFKKNLAAGYQLTCIGGPSHPVYRKTRSGNTLADRAAIRVLEEAGQHEILAFDPSQGSDEQQYGSPGFNLPVGCMMRTMYGRYAEYHTSLDNKTFIRFDKLEESLDILFETIQALENNDTWLSTAPFCEPQLGRRGLYPTLGSQRTMEKKVSALLWVLNLADGGHDLLAMAERSGLSLATLNEAAADLFQAGLLKKKE